MSFVIPVRLAYDGKNHVNRFMGPFSHSTEREFALAVNRRAIDDCTSISQLKPVTKNLLEGWASMQTAMQSLMLENIQLRQALDQRDQQLAHTRRRLWPWQK